MAFQVFKESEVRDAIIKKAPYRPTSGKRSKHTVIALEHNGIMIDHFKIPNSHSREFTQGKAGDLARKLRLDMEEYNLFVKCKLKKEAYLEILNKIVPLR